MSRLPRSLVVFLLILSFGILFAGCTTTQPESDFEEFTFTDEDLQQVHEIASSDGASMEGTETDLTVSSSVPGTAGDTSSVLLDSTQVVINPAKQKLYDGLRLSSTDQGSNVYRVNNAFLNVRASMSVTSEQIERLDQGNVVTVVDIPNAQWAKVKLANQKEGYVAFRYLARVTTEQKLPEEKKQFEGKYFVDFEFLNVRKDASSQSEKIGQLDGQAIIKPNSINGEWARVAVDGREGYVSAQYLKPFQPVFLVRQEEYVVPILQYRATDSASITALPKHVAALKTAGKKLMTLKALQDLVLAQETRDARVQPNTVILTVAGVTAGNVKQVTDALGSAGVAATLFIQTKDVGITGITEKTVLNLLANGNDLQSEGHTGDDLRSLTDSQVTLELGQSKKLLEELTHKEVYAVSYPMGAVNDRVMSIAAKTGYLFGISQSPDSKFTRSQFLRLPSLYVSGTMAPEDVVKLAK